MDPIKNSQTEAGADSQSELEIYQEHLTNLQGQLVGIMVQNQELGKYKT